MGGRYSEKELQKYAQESPCVLKLSCACIYLKGNSRMCKTVGTERSVVALAHRFRESWERNGRGVWGMMEILHILIEVVITWM